MINEFIDDQVKGKSEKGLPGVIKGCGIVCYCETCDGKEVSFVLMFMCNFICLVVDLESWLFGC